MKNALNPNTIYRKILQHEISFIEGIEYLISIIEKSDITNPRLECLEILYKLKTHDNIVFKTLEDCLISDENEEIRIMSAQIILESFLQDGKECLKWALLKDQSSVFLKTLGKMLKNSNLDQYEILYTVYLQRLEKIGEKFELVSNEVPFLLDLEFDLNNYKCFNWSSNSKLIYDDYVIFRIQDQHILELSLSLKNQVPSSIVLLKNLENLNLSCNNLTELPDSLSELKNLKNLDLSWNNFIEMPKVLDKLHTIEKLNFKNNLIEKQSNYKQIK